MGKVLLYEGNKMDEEAAGSCEPPLVRGCSTHRSEQMLVRVCRGTSLIRKRTPLGAYRRPVSRVQAGS